VELHGYNDKSINLSAIFRGRNGFFKICGMEIVWGYFAPSISGDGEFPMKAFLVQMMTAQQFPT